MPETPYQKTNIVDSAGNVIENFGGDTSDSSTPITGQTLETGGSGNLGWLSSIRKALTSGLKLLDASGSIQATIKAASAIAQAVDTALVVALRLREVSYLSGTINTSGDNTIIAAPGAGQRIIITSLIMQLEVSTATTALIKSGSSTIRKRSLCQAQGDGLFLYYPPGDALRLETNQALVINLSGANSVGYSVEWLVI
ncbi:hypothetical protein [Anabaena sp. CCY 9910]|uniref:hypothetical protein n=1 Tax=Anabaena sp. CCY 9910 TaxID=3103870 RepID=UPI0039DFED8E